MFTMEHLLKRMHEIGFIVEAKKLSRQESLFLAMNANTRADHFTPIFKEMVSFDTKRPHFVFGGYINDSYFSNSYFRAIAWCQEASFFYFRVYKDRYLLGVDLAHSRSKYKPVDILHFYEQLINEDYHAAAILHISMSMDFLGLFKDALETITDEELLKNESTLLEACVDDEKSEFMAQLLEEKGKRNLFVSSSSMEL